MLLSIPVSPLISIWGFVEHNQLQTKMSRRNLFMVGRHTVLYQKVSKKSTNVLKATAMGLVSGVDSPIRGTGTPRATLPPSSNTQCYSAHVLTKAGKWKYLHHNVQTSLCRCWYKQHSSWTLAHYTIWTKFGWTWFFMWTGWRSVLSKEKTRVQMLTDRGMRREKHGLPGLTEGSV